MQAVILAGGLGERMRPLTKLIPKPLLPIGDSSALEIAIRCLRKHGVREIAIATNYRGEYVSAFLGDGSRYGVKLRYSQEREPLGTCGPLRLLAEHLTEPFFLMNGDVLTTLDFRSAYEFATGSGADLTAVTAETSVSLPFGQVHGEDDLVTRVEEKPDLKAEVLTGIYVASGRILELIPEGTPYGMDELIRDLLRRGRKVARHRLEGFWLDVGLADGYVQAEEAYRRYFRDLEAGPDSTEGGNPA